MNNLNDMDICPLLTGNTMEVTRKTKTLWRVTLLLRETRYRLYATA